MNTTMKMFVAAIAVVTLLAVGNTAFAKTKTATATADVIISDMVTSVTATAINFGSLSYTNATQAGYAILDSSSGYATAVAFDTAVDQTGTAITHDAVVVAAGASGSLTIVAGAVGTLSAVSFPDITLATGNPGETIALAQMALFSEDPTTAALAVGNNIYYLGGSLALTAATVAGTYTGTGTVTVTY